MIFESGDFDFAGVDSNFYNLIITSINAGDESEERVIGLSRSVNYNNNSFINTTSENVELDMQFAFEKNGEMYIPKDFEVEEVISWLFRPTEPKILSVGYLSYLVIFTGATYNANGWLNLTCSSQPYLYTNIIASKAIITEDKQCSYVCNDVLDESYPIITIESKVDNTLTIENSIGVDNWMRVNIKAGETIEIDCANKEIISNMDGVYNRVDIKNYIRFYWGTNRVRYSLSDKSNVCKVSVKFQDRLSLGLRGN